MKQLKRSIIGMGVSLGCMIIAVVPLIISVVVMFGAMGGDSGMWGFICEDGLRTSSLAIMGLWLLGIVMVFSGLISAVVFWIIGLVFMWKTSMKQWVWIDICVFVVCLPFMWSSGMSLVIWWLVHFLGYKLLSVDNDGDEK